MRWGCGQSDALFSHVKRLPELTARLRQLGFWMGSLAVGASATPREVEGSYMPCFLAGVSQAKVLADVLGVPYYFCSHQQGHLAAAAWSSGHLELLDAPFLAWHLSGGTTELLRVQPEGVNVRAAAIGGTSDISAGQLIDRTGQVLGLNFPAGKELDRLSQTADKELSFPVKVKDMTFSLSRNGEQGASTGGAGGTAGEYRGIFPSMCGLCGGTGDPAGDGEISGPARAVLWRRGIQRTAAPGDVAAVRRGVRPTAVFHR